MKIREFLYMCIDIDAVEENFSNEVAVYSTGWNLKKKNYIQNE